MGKYSFAVAALVAAAYATPQQMNFDAIEAAPLVASGPTAAAGNPDQTASLFTSFTIAGPTSAPSVLAAVVARSPVEKRDNIISASTSVSAYGAALGQANVLTSIQAGVSYYLTGGAKHSIFGNLNNYGSLVISQTSYIAANLLGGGLTCNWDGHNGANGNLLNALGALLQITDISGYASASFKLTLHSIINGGTLQLCARGDLGGSIFSIISDLDAINTGLISYEQVNANMGASFGWANSLLGGSAAASASISGTANLWNNGTFRLINTAYHNTQNVLGNGCFQIGVGATLYLEAGSSICANAAANVALQGQSVFFADASAVLHFEAGVYAQTGVFGAKVYGYGSGHALEFAESIQSFVYVSATGTLHVSFWSGNTVQIYIGLGYDATLFVKKNNYSRYSIFGLNAIFYLGVCPSQNVPGVCTPSAPLCSGGNPYKPTRSISSSSAKSTSASSSKVVVSTPSSAPLTTSSSSVVSSSSTVPSTVVTPTTTAAPITSTVTSAPVTTSTSATCPNLNHSPYYAALSTGYTTNPALAASSTTTANQPCVTQPEAGTSCGFINPEDPCSPQPDGYGPVPSPDTPDAFLAFQTLHDDANNAPKQIPSADGNVYNEVFVDLNASVSAQSYLGLYTLQSYDVATCAALCDCTNLCTSFNIYAERDPSLNPSNNDSTAPTVWGYYCPNPPSQTDFKCTLWGSQISAKDATNYGEYREQFHVVITASNGYDKTNQSTPANPTGPAPGTTSSSSSVATSSTSSVGVTSSTSSSAAATTTSSSSAVVVVSSTKSSSSWGSRPTGGYPGGGYGGPSHPWGSPKSCNGKAIDAPAYSLGGKFFPGPYNPQVCSDYAFAQNAANVAVNGAGAQVVEMFNAYYLHKNGKPHGTYCGLYNSFLDLSLCLNVGASFNGDQFDVHASFVFELAVAI